MTSKQQVNSISSIIKLSSQSFLLLCPFSAFTVISSAFIYGDDTTHPLATALWMPSVLHLLERRFSQSPMPQHRCASWQPLLRQVCTDSSRKAELILQSFISRHFCACSCHISYPVFSHCSLSVIHRSTTWQLQGLLNSSVDEEKQKWKQVYMSFSLFIFRMPQDLSSALTGWIWTLERSRQPLGCLLQLNKHLCLEWRCWKTEVTLTVKAEVPQHFTDLWSTTDFHKTAIKTYKGCTP